MNIGTQVVSNEHPNSLGTVTRVTEQGVTIEWITPPSEQLPFGHAIFEYWPNIDFPQLAVITR